MATTPTRPAWSPSQDWYVRFSKLQDPLTRQESKALENCFGRSEKAQKELRQLKRDWRKINAVAQYVALLRTTDDNTAKIFFGKATKRWRDTQLREAIRASETAATAVKDMTRLWSPLASTGGLEVLKLLELRDWANAVIARLADERKAMKDHGTLPTAKVKTGKPEQPGTYRLRALASYFRYRQWDVSSKRDSFFAQVCAAVLTGTDAPINPTRLKAVVNSGYSYEAILPFADTRRPSKALAKKLKLVRIGPKT